jgi:hypothetical protein
VRCAGKERRGEGGLGEKWRETNPFPVRVLVLLVGFVQIHAVETADGECHDYLDEAEDGMQDVGEGHFGAVEDAHFGWLGLNVFFLWGVGFVEFGLRW